MVGRCGCSQHATLRLQLSLARTDPPCNRNLRFCILKRNSLSEGVVRTDPAAEANSASLNHFLDRPARL